MDISLVKRVMAIAFIYVFLLFIEIAILAQIGFSMPLFFVLELMKMLYVFVAFYLIFSVHIKKLTKENTELLNNRQNMLAQKYTHAFLQKQAELNAMQSQINPHFLYNVLDSIRGQVLEEGSSEAADILYTLSSMFRYTIDQKRKLVTIGEELKSLQYYIKIQQYRFSNRFGFVKEIDLDDQIMDYLIPKMTLQPIVENALQHGLDDMPFDGVVTVRIFSTKKTVSVSVIDNGVGMNESKVNELNMKFNQGSHVVIEEGKRESGKGTGVALMNVNARVKLHFGNDYGLHVFSSSGTGTEIKILLPKISNIEQMEQFNSLEINSL